MLIDVTRGVGAQAYEGGVAPPLTVAKLDYDVLITALATRQ